jgi:hypothetical protein
MTEQAHDHQYIIAPVANTIVAIKPLDGRRISPEEAERILDEASRVVAKATASATPEATDGTGS